MSYHEIEVVNVFTVICHCGLNIKKKSAGAAEAVAREHIDGGWDGKKEVEGKYDHIVEITESILIGRQAGYTLE